MGGAPYFLPVCGAEGDKRLIVWHMYEKVCCCLPLISSANYIQARLIHRKRQAVICSHHFLSNFLFLKRHTLHAGLPSSWPILCPFHPCSVWVVPRDLLRKTEKSKEDVREQTEQTKVLPRSSSAAHLHWTHCTPVHSVATLDLFVKLSDILKTQDRCFPLLMNTGLQRQQSFQCLRHFSDDLFQTKSGSTMLFMHPYEIQDQKWHWTS